VFRFYLVLLFFLPVIVASSLAAEEKGKPEDNIPLLTDKQEEKIDTARENVSEWLVRKSLWVDSFFDDENYSDEANKTRLKVSLKLGYSKIDDLEVKPRASLRIRLPMLNKKFNVILAASDESQFDVDESSITDAPLHEDSEKNEQTASLQYFLLEKSNTNVSISAGLSWDYAYAGLRFRRSNNYGEWRTRFVNNLRYYTDDGWEDKASLELDHPLSEQLLFRKRLTVEWLEQENGLPHSISFQLFQFIDKNRAFKYQTSVLFDTQPNYRVTDVQLRVRYRQRFYRDWLALEIEPFVTFPEKVDHEANPGIVFNLEAIFGHSTE
jgi:hypothetical protein